MHALIIYQFILVIHNKARTRFKKKVRKLTRRNNPLSMHQITQDLNRYLKCWVAYFRIQEFKKIFNELDAWIGSRLRSMQLKERKNPLKFQRIMTKRGFPPQEAHRVWVKMTEWQSVNRREIRFAMNLQWFRMQGLTFLHDFTKRTSEQLMFSR